MTLPPSRWSALSLLIVDDEPGMRSFLAKALARQAILDWEGVGDAEGQPLPVSPAAIDALLDIWPVFEAFQTIYVSKGLLLDAEKNVSPPLPIGSSAGAAAIAPPVDPSVPSVPHG